MLSCEPDHPTMKPYQAVPIQDCGEPLVPISPHLFVLTIPHPYQAFAAPYGLKSPYFLRQGVVSRLQVAQTLLQQAEPGWRIKVFDAYRPVEVQQFMVNHTLAELAQTRHLILETLSPQEREALLQEVYQFWALPSLDPATPPPHSTGAAIDVTLVNEQGQDVNMGSPIDEVSPRSYPNYFAEHQSAEAQQYDHDRQLLADCMIKAGFQRHPNEWWHFSFGDQMWVWLSNPDAPLGSISAQYGRVS
jgi:zinc D-Ala-D-Ala dipeptidase